MHLFWCLGVTRYTSWVRTWTQDYYDEDFRSLHINPLRHPAHMSIYLEIFLITLHQNGVALIHTVWHLFIEQHSTSCSGHMYMNIFLLAPLKAVENRLYLNSQKPKTHILLGAPVSVFLVSCADCRPCLCPIPAPPGWTGIRSPGNNSGSDFGSCLLPGRRRGLWGFHSPLPSSPVWGSRYRASFLCACPCRHCGLVSWTAYIPQYRCCQHPHCLWESRSFQPARGGREGSNVNILAIYQP